MCCFAFIIMLHIAASDVILTYHCYAVTLGSLESMKVWVISLYHLHSDKKSIVFYFLMDLHVLAHEVTWDRAMSYLRILSRGLRYCQTLMCCFAFIIMLHTAASDVILTDHCDAVTLVFFLLVKV